MKKVHYSFTDLPLEKSTLFGLQSTLHINLEINDGIALVIIKHSFSSWQYSVNFWIMRKLQGVSFPASVSDENIISVVNIPSKCIFFSERKKPGVGGAGKER